MDDELRLVSLSQIVMNPYQPRREFNHEELQELADSIQAVGILHPPLVRPISGSNNYELISGERRIRAAKLASLDPIPVYIRKTDHGVSAQAALIENVQRVDLNPLEIAFALKKLIEEFGLTQEDLAHRIGKKRSTIANYLRLLSLPHFIQLSIKKGLLSMGHAKAILSLIEEEKQILLHEMIQRDSLSVREAEQTAKRISEKAQRKQLNFVHRDFHLEQMAEKIQEKLGTKVLIQSKGKKGRISIDYYSFEDLERLLTLFGSHSHE